MGDNSKKNYILVIEMVIKMINKVNVWFKKKDDKEGVMRWYFLV